MDRQQVGSSFIACLQSRNAERRLVFAIGVTLGIAIG